MPCKSCLGRPCVVLYCVALLVVSYVVHLVYTMYMKPNNYTCTLYRTYMYIHVHVHDVHVEVLDLQYM